MGRSRKAFAHVKSIIGHRCRGFGSRGLCGEHGSNRNSDRDEHDILGAAHGRTTVARAAKTRGNAGAGNHASA